MIVVPCCSWRWCQPKEVILGPVEELFQVKTTDEKARQEATPDAVSGVFERSEEGGLQEAALGFILNPKNAPQQWLNCCTQ